MGAMRLAFLVLVGVASVRCQVQGKNPPNDTWAYMAGVVRPSLFQVNERTQRMGVRDRDTYYHAQLS